METFVRKIALPHIDPYGQGTLPSPTAGCRIRFPESLLMLRQPISQRRRFVKSPGDEGGRNRVRRIWLRPRTRPRENEAVFCEVSDGEARCPSAFVIDPALS